ncbi:methylenetetrahydrofolate reductase (NADPH) [Rhizobium leguminosarum]|uniref:Methylenetetrahydrofolate reductase n=1 Tax=Rhizobium leguminosarum TaxID=384 RepID=A0AAE2SV19_RHILE|nr:MULTISPECIES: methylenetetrahydrofolate reductase [Rhizobium]MBB4289121.1 methylenetetrahydrofolate reductase (NADPH) [Rhizobium leguminosarum]MBB4294786.1 methylenetetrahydrofolate reductase (NADPH) [Rhizobium leguminosarum]MBB4306179.1 methylenetetrahydrofolate reductase (NADPH) [Rhizobium leguminosarum]MBB4418241.1 methylenetetrahydrofolate reductase (NADPH) [Rhizobium leguminosarum]MBB4433086.1 methylenetetrahydrofolate reductase (NADPH) [Rhizobium esperanzae]
MKLLVRRTGQVRRALTNYTKAILSEAKLEIRLRKCRRKGIGMVNLGLKSKLEYRDALERFSLEVTAKDASQLSALSGDIPKGTIISVPYLPSDSEHDRIVAAKTVRQLGCEPMPHIAARRIGTEAELSDVISNFVREAQVARLLILAGDLDPPKGAFQDTATILRSSVLEQHGIRHVAIAGHPEGHPSQTSATLTNALLEKRQILEALNLEWSIFTQFTFSAEPVLDWIAGIRSKGITVPIHVGIPGPASVRTLLRFAAVCGVSASTAVFRKYGLSITQLLTSAGPDVLVDDYANALVDEAYGDVRLHFYPFGGVRKSVEWIRSYQT